MVAIIIFTLLLSPMPTVDANNGQGDLVVAADALHLRQGPGLSYPILTSLQRGDQLQTVQRDGDWVQVKVSDQIGWVAAWLTKSATPSEATITKSVISQVDRLNLRAEPSLSASVITQLTSGSEATYLKQQNDWVQIQFNNYTGWVSLAYVSIVEQTEQVEQQAVPAIAEANTFIVNVDAVNIRKKPDLNSKHLGVATRGTQFKILGRENNWVQIQYTDKEIAWVYSFYGTFSNDNTAISVSAPSDVDQASNKVVIIYDGTNIREQASTSSNVVYRANAGESFEKIDSESDWYKVQLEDGTTGFVANWVVSTSNEQKNAATNQKANRKKGTLKGLTIAIDPGHGGNDHGTTGTRGTAEKDINLLTAELLKSKLRSAGANVILTRESDEYVGLRSRVSVSNMQQADAFISIHYDATGDSSVSGFTTYYMNSKQKDLAIYVHEGLAKTVDIRDRGVQQGNYLVLRENRQPAILLELGYLSNANEERTITTAFYREQATLGIYQGLIKYFDQQLE